MGRSLEEGGGRSWFLKTSHFLFPVWVWPVMNKSLPLRSMSESSQLALGKGLGQLGKEGQDYERRGLGFDDI